MKFKFDNKTGMMVGWKTVHLSKKEIENLGGIVPDDRHMNPGTGYIPQVDVFRVKMLASRYDIDVQQLNGYDREIGGHLYRFERTITMS